MALVVFLRGVNVGGRRTFSPSALVKALKLDAVNTDAGGTFVVRRARPVRDRSCRREMKGIAHLGQIDKILGVRLTTRSWSTILKIARTLEGSR